MSSHIAFLLKLFASFGQKGMFLCQCRLVLAHRTFLLLITAQLLTAVGSHTKYIIFI